MEGQADLLAEMRAQREAGIGHLLDAGEVIGEIGASAAAGGAETGADWRLPIIDIVPFGIERCRALRRHLGGGGGRMRIGRRGRCGLRRALIR